MFLELICLYGGKMFLKKVEFFFLQIIFLVFLNYFDVLVLIKNKFKKILF